VSGSASRAAAATATTRSHSTGAQRARHVQGAATGVLLEDHACGREGLRSAVSGVQGEQRTAFAINTGSGVIKRLIARGNIMRWISRRWVGPPGLLPRSCRPDERLAVSGAPRGQDNDQRYRGAAQPRYVTIRVLHGSHHRFGEVIPVGGVQKVGVWPGHRGGPAARVFARIELN
jgi:hypothetical protein